MDHLRDRQKVKRRLYSRTSRIALFIILIILIKATWNIYTKHAESAENVRRAERDLAELQVRQAELSGKIQDLETGEGKDRAIREKFGVAKDGETMVMIVRGKEAAPTTTPEVKKSWWGNVWEGILNIF